MVIPTHYSPACSLVWPCYVLEFCCFLACEVQHAQTTKLHHMVYKYTMYTHVTPNIYVGQSQPSPRDNANFSCFQRYPVPAFALYVYFLVDFSRANPVVWLLSTYCVVSQSALGCLLFHFFQPLLYVSFALT